jgi:hypothetical protein
MFLPGGQDFGTSNLIVQLIASFQDHPSQASTLSTNQRHAPAIGPVALLGNGQYNTYTMASQERTMPFIKNLASSGAS